MSVPVAFIGLGVMGEPMAGHLLVAGHPLTVHTRTKSKAEALVSRGAKWSSTPAEAVKDADVIFICVTDTPDVEAVVLGQDGLIGSVREGTIIVDHSTISPSATRALAAEVSRRGAHFLDAPISGGDVGARSATLAIMVGGDRAAFDRVEPLLRVMGKTITYCGASGNGQLTKLVNQILVSITNMAVCEAMAFAIKSGLDPITTIQAIAGGAAGSWQLSNLGPRMVKGDFAPGFTIDLMQKDFRLVMQAAQEANAPLPAASLVHQLFTSAQAQGQGKAGTQALFTVLHRLANQ
ncbi:MAG TPA: NAD(P)-dependent oxidoreductase [Tepidisphaeraceae bacterium]|jgi:3-hydroxyisobutyrate dehydrogenase